MAIVARSLQAVVGMATINGIDWADRRASIGYWLLPRYRGHGFAQAAVALLPDLASDLGLIRLQAAVEPNNHASQSVLRAAGFTEEGKLRAYSRIGGRNRDMLIFARLTPASDPAAD